MTAAAILPTCSAPVLLATLLGTGLTAQARNVSGGPLIAAQACYDVRHYALTLRVDPAGKRIEGSVVLRAVATAASDSLALDLDDELDVTAVHWGEGPVPFRHEDGRIWITPPAPLLPAQEIALAVGYGGTPHVARNPPWDGGFTWAQTKSGAPWIATSCQGEGADLWWPCKDHPSDKPDGVDLRITVPEGLVVASNGIEVEPPQRSKGQVTFHWRTAQPISNYCVALNIAPYVELTETFTCIDGTAMPVRFFVLPESKASAQRCMKQFLDHLAVFEQILGPYPFRAEKYGIAETPHLGMEHQTIVAYGNGFHDEDYDWLHNHELAHEWWGNLVTCRDWKDMWLHEGFGTYMQPLYLERRFGRARYLAELQRHRTMNRTPVAPQETKNSAEICFSTSGNDIYYKGSLILHTLRWQLGDEAFFTCLRRFCYPDAAHERATDGSQVRLVDSADFIALVAEVAGADLGWFFAAYLRQPRRPKLGSELVDGTLHLRWSLPGELRFEVPVPVVVGGELVRVAMSGNRGELAVGRRQYAIDPDQLVLMERPRVRR